MISVATLDQPRVFTNEDLAVMQTLASEAAVALERLRTSLALEEALTRERLLASIARRLRGELDLAAALAGAAEELGRALDASRCSFRIGELPDGLSDGGRVARAVAWACWRGRAGASSSSSAPRRSRELRPDRSARLARRRHPRGCARGGRGFVCLFRPAGQGMEQEVELVLLSGVAAEVGLALRLGRLLEENEERLAQQSALLRAAHVLSSDLDLGVVLQRLADQLARLLEADAADCYLLDGDRGVFRCVAVHGSTAGWSASSSRWVGARRRRRP